MGARRVRGPLLILLGGDAPALSSLGVDCLACLPLSDLMDLMVQTFLVLIPLGFGGQALPARFEFSSSASTIPLAFHGLALHILSELMVQPCFSLLDLLV